MPFINWSERFSVGNDTIDRQHQELFALINQAYEAGTKNDPLKEYESSWQVLSALLDYTRFHFTEEEGMLEQVGYPALAAHKELHRALVARIETMLSNLEEGAANIDSEVLCRFIKDWIEQHVLTVDRQYMPYLVK